MLPVAPALLSLLLGTAAANGSPCYTAMEIELAETPDRGVITSTRNEG